MIWPLVSAPKSIWKAGLHSIGSVLRGLCSGASYAWGLMFYGCSLKILIQPMVTGWVAHIIKDRLLGLFMEKPSLSQKPLKDWLLVFNISNDGKSPFYCGGLKYVFIYFTLIVENLKKRYFVLLFSKIQLAFCCCCY